MEAFAYMRQADDRPDAQYVNTAVYDQSKREVWTFVRRDYQTEQELLSQVKERVMKKPSLTTTQPATTAPSK